MRSFRVDYVRGYNCFYNEGDHLDELSMLAHGYMEQQSTIDDINNTCIWYRFSEIMEEE